MLLFQNSVLNAREGQSYTFSCCLSIEKYSNWKIFTNHFVSFKIISFFISRLKLTWIVGIRGSHLKASQFQNTTKSCSIKDTVYKRESYSKDLINSFQHTNSFVKYGVQINTKTRSNN